MSNDVKDIFTIIANQLLSNPTINQLTKKATGGNRIKAYDYPEKADRSKAFILMKPVGPPMTSNAGSDEELQIRFTIQIACESPIRMEVKQLQHEIKKEMKKLNYAQMADGLDEYFEATGHFVDARRYRGNSVLYDTNY
ncbi:hypothetical protein [Pediococcus acidilactici]|uniref:hypothetical protein n=1 Tax=Pediococcus acidilactici TaxID=1254 RepID=UPI00232F4FDE|nr:hypothetical protein [Pediococcus acidilactici]MDB8858811.1 hypothetical protein [Pediococcus acidilactici]MDB8861101.1 hypothetical protein [Pediococcus acidilactici]MDB8862007.1 hypothetical protein [Pediococcus acidilactici]MDB8865992.1 hypothetical protein [Pediococcus acidilactici]